MSHRGRGWLLWAALWLAPDAGAHELEANRATLVLRDGHHVQLSLYIDLGVALARTLAPDQPVSEFILAATAMPPDAFAQLYQQGTARLQHGTVLMRADGEALSLRHWQWPDADSVRQGLQTLTMNALVAADAHGHPPIREVRAEANSTLAVDELILRLPPDLGEVIVVWYQPRQRQIDRGQDARLSFDAP